MTALSARCFHGIFFLIFAIVVLANIQSALATSAFVSCGNSVPVSSSSTSLPSRISVRTSNIADVTQLHRPRALHVPNRRTKTALPAHFESAISLAQTTADAYGALLIEHPLPTKSITAGVLCGISDVIAQRRDPNRAGYNIGRTVRFASKGCLGGIVWMFWYNWLDEFLSLDSTTSLYALLAARGVTVMNDGSPLLLFAKDHLGVVTTVLSIVLEQFVWCPLVYGTFEIPVSTLMNGGKPSSIKDEVDAKLNGLLVVNAKVWTVANIAIYNAPLEWRLFIGNCIDIFWQSIVSDVSADCGKVGSDECEIDAFPQVDDPSFYAEKSRI